MKARELRIGNLVNHIRKGVVVVGIMELDFIDKGVLDVESIPLTEEWLLKLGFECCESTTAKQYYLGFNSVTNDWLFSIVWLDKPEQFGYPNAPFYRNGRHTLYYVHQLQNLYFALTGEELTIKE